MHKNVIRMEVLLSSRALQGVSMDSVVMEQHEKVMTFSYTSFLANESSKNLTFMEALKVFLKSLNFKSCRSEINISDFETIAFKLLSTNTSDVMNIVRLVELAQASHICTLIILMPYSLDEQQLLEIEELSSCRIQLDLHSQDRILIYMRE